MKGKTNRARDWKIGTKLVLKSVGILTAILVAAFAVIITETAKTAEASAVSRITALAQSDAAAVKAMLEEPLDAARTIAQSMQGYRDIAAQDRRSFYNSMMKSVLEGNPDFLGIWVCWEPNALDGLDSQYVNTEASDETGRFIPYWQRPTGNPADAAGGLREEGWRLLPAGKEFGQERSSSLFYEIAGKNVLLTSVAVPVRAEDGSIVGVAGVDLALSDLQSTVFDDGGFESIHTFVLSHTGTFVIHPDSERVGTALADSGLKDAGAIAGAIASGESLQCDSDSQITGIRAKSVYYPVVIGNTVTPWSVAIEVDSAEATAAATQITIILIVIFVCLLAVITVALLLIIRSSISKPIQETASFAKALASGSLDEAVTIQSHDEIGQLKSTLDQEVRDAFKKVAAAQVISEKQSRYQNEQVGKLVVNLERLAKGTFLRYVCRRARWGYAGNL
jgi:methyl-accepting chemotaxis protein